MKKQYSTKKALVASALSLVLCCAMLIGTTFAWFTDAVVYGDPAEPPYEDDAVQGDPEENLLLNFSADNSLNTYYNHPQK